MSECLPRLASRPKIACALAFASLHPMLGRTYVRTLHARAELYDLSRGRDAIELVLSTVKYLQRAHASYMYIKSAERMIKRDVARREGSVCARGRRSYAYKYACDTYVVASVPGLPRSVRVLIMRRRQTFENRGRPGLKYHVG